MNCRRTVALLLLALATGAGAAYGRPLDLDDLRRLREVSDLRISPDGQWVAYTVDAADTRADEYAGDIWMTSWDGKTTLRLTGDSGSESQPRWSPDGRYLSFLSSRGGDEDSEQLWLLPRAGGEAERITAFRGGVTEYAWSPDGLHLAVIVADEDPVAGLPESSTRPPIVIDRFYFKEDETGYLGARRRHLFVLDVVTRKADLLTPGAFDESLPAWSPDGRSIAFFSKRAGDDPDRHETVGLYVVEARPGAAVRLVTSFEGVTGDGGWMSEPAAWSPDGKIFALAVGGDPKLIWYGTTRVAVVPSAGGKVRELTARLDRNAWQVRWSGDGRWIYFLLEDDGSQHLARIRPGGGEVQRLTPAGREVRDYDVHRFGRLAIIQSTPDQPAEAFALDGPGLRPLSRQNDDWLGEITLRPVEEIGFASRDGTPIRGFLVTPAAYDAGRRYPTLLRIHGGPVSQFASAFEFEWQLFAARGYAVVAANPRGSSGRGEAFSRAIFADWGNKDVEDVVAAVDYAVGRGIADAGRLGVGGWSYGGILTNYVIARDNRFRAATSGAGASNILAGFGTDQYVREYEAELGTPWQNPDAWLRLSFPFLRADRIVTPTLFLCGELDFNVPLLNSEQMYQALRSLGVPTQLVIYPGEFHSLSRPSYVRDRLQRYLDWYGRYLGG